MVVDSVLSHMEFGLIDNRKDTSHFTWPMYNDQTLLLKEFEVSQKKYSDMNMLLLNQKVSEPKTMGWVHFQGEISGIRRIWPAEIMK